MSNNNSNNVGIEWEIEVAFSRLIGPLAIMAELKSYKISYKEIHTLIHIIAGWGARFQNDRNLFFIEPEKLLDVYYRLDALRISTYVIIILAMRASYLMRLLFGCMS